MKIKLTIGQDEFQATLNDSQTAADFAALLPLEVTLKDFASREKVSELPASLSIEGAAPGTKAAIGDITYYSPWGTLAIFYGGFGYASGLVTMGSIDEKGAKLAAYREPVQARIEAI